MNCHALARKQAKMENTVGPIIYKALTNFFGFSTYPVRNEAVLHTIYACIQQSLQIGYENSMKICNFGYKLNQNFHIYFRIRTCYMQNLSILVLYSQNISSA